MLKTLDKKCKNFLDQLNDKCEKFLEKVSDRLEPVCELLNSYPSLAVCVILITVIILIASCFIP